MPRRGLPLLVAVVLLGACSSTSDTSSPSTSAPPSTTTAQSTDAPPEDGTAERASVGCEEGGGAPEMGAFTDEVMASSDVERTYMRYVPSSYGGDEPVPLVIDLHGYMEGNVVHSNMSDMYGKAEEDGFVVLTPQGTGDPVFWNAGPTTEGPADVQFISDLIDATGDGLCIDLDRVYATGLSNGAMMSSLLACELSDKVAAIAPVAGLVFPNGCAPERAVPIVAFHGTDDPLVNYEMPEGEGEPAAPEAASVLPFNEEAEANFAAVNFQSIPKGLADWAELQGCADDPTETEVSPSVALVSYGECDDGSVVELYVVHGGGHTWPGSALTAGQVTELMGSTTTEIDANDLMWEFFMAHPL